MTEERYYSVQEAADRYDVDPRTIRRWIDEGYFPGTSRKNPRNPKSHHKIPQSAIDYFDTTDEAASEK